MSSVSGGWVLLWHLSTGDEDTQWLSCGIMWLAAMGKICQVCVALSGLGGRDTVWGYFLQLVLLRHMWMWCLKTLLWCQEAFSPLRFCVSVSGNILCQTVINTHQWVYQLLYSFPWFHGSAPNPCRMVEVAAFWACLLVLILGGLTVFSMAFSWINSVCGRGKAHGQKKSPWEKPRHDCVC